MKTLFTAIFIVCLSGTSVVQGQLKRAEKKLQNLAYAGAAENYEKVVSKSPEDQQSVTRLADCYRLLNNSVEAEKWYAKSVQFSEVEPLTYFHYGMSLMNNKKWSAATPQFEKYLAMKPGDTRGQHMLESSREYETFMQDSFLYDVKITNINSPAADFSPNIYRDELVFASARKKSRKKFGWSDTYFLQLFTAKYRGNAKLGEPEMLKSRTNSDFHEAHVTFSPDGKTMVFSRNNLLNGKIGKDNENTIRLKTYVSTLSKGKWKKISSIPYNNDEYSVGHPSFSPDGKLLYFVSDRPGGHGGTDIYVAEVDLAKGIWGEPKNLGPSVNTSGNEMFPWISKDGDLFFSSNGWKGLGGLDLFLATGLEDSDIHIQNLGYPINSSRDDFAMVIDHRNGLCFFSSNRPNGVGDDDIYSVQTKIAVKGRVIDAQTGKLIPDAKVEVYSLRYLNGSSLSDEKGAFIQGAEPGAKYYAIASKEGYTGTKIKFDTYGKKLTDEVELLLELTKDGCEEKVAFKGQLLDEAGSPLAGKKVKIIEKEQEVETDEFGNIYADLSPTKSYEFVYDGPELSKPLREPIDMKALISNDTLRGKLTVAAPKIGDVFYIIYYNYDKYDIRNRDARPELDRLALFMSSNPKVKIELTSHTDSRASHAYNVTLSKNRATEAYQYLVKKGISKDRMSYQWKGEKELTNGCKDGVECSEVDHQLNRRTEFKIIAK